MMSRTMDSLPDSYSLGISLVACKGWSISNKEFWNEKYLKFLPDSYNLDISLVACKFW